MTSSHYCPEPGPKIGSTVVCGICRVSRQRALDGQVAVIPYGQTQPPKPGRQEWIEVRDFGSSEVRYLPGYFVPDPPDTGHRFTSSVHHYDVSGRGTEYQIIEPSWRRSTRRPLPLTPTRLPPPRGPRTIPLTPAPVPARHVTPPRTECVTCGMGDLPLDGAGLCTVCAQVAAFRHQARQPRTATGDMVLSYVCAVLTVLIMTLVVAWAWG